MLDKTEGVEACIQISSGGTSSGTSNQESTKSSVGSKQEISRLDVAKAVTPDTDPDIDLDIEDMYMIFEASEQSQQDFDTLNHQVIQNGGSYDPIRRTKSTEPPADLTIKKFFSRTRTMP